MLTNYVFLTTMGLFYRATKPLLVPLLLGLLFLVWARLRPDAAASAPPWDFAAVFGLGCAMSALDRQGFFYLVVLTGFLFLFWAVRRGKVALLWGGAAATLASALYNYKVGPWLVHAVNGYWPRFNYQRMPIRKLADPGYYVKAAELLPDYVRHPPGRLSGVALRGGRLGGNRRMDSLPCAAALGAPRTRRHAGTPLARAGIPRSLPWGRRSSCSRP